LVQLLEKPYTMGQSLRWFRALASEAVSTLDADHPTLTLVSHTHTTHTGVQRGDPEMRDAQAHPT
jgi:hypothetical protein